MAGTSAREIYDLFGVLVTDYRLTDLFNTSEIDFDTFMQAWLIFSINDFYVCDQSLSFDSQTGVFTETLSQENKVILSTLMMKYWFTKEVNDITQFRLHIKDRDFDVASEAQNLKEKRAYLAEIMERCSQLLNDYSYRKVDWDSWYAQVFTGA